MFKSNKLNLNQKKYLIHFFLAPCGSNLAFITERNFRFFLKIIFLKMAGWQRWHYDAKFPNKTETENLLMNKS